eukprot:3698476-Rhodomonas_salina.2
MRESQAQHDSLTRWYTWSAVWARGSRLWSARTGLVPHTAATASLRRPARHRQTQTGTDRHRPTQTDTDDTDRHRQTQARQHRHAGIDTPHRETQREHWQRGTGASAQTQRHGQTRTDTGTSAQTRRHADVDTPHKETQSDTDRHRHVRVSTDTQTRRHADTQTRRRHGRHTTQTDTGTDRHRQARAPQYRHTDTQTHRHTDTRCLCLPSLECALEGAPYRDLPKLHIVIRVVPAVGRSLLFASHPHSTPAFVRLSTALRV